MFDRIQSVVIKDISDTRHSIITIRLFHNASNMIALYEMEIPMTAQQLYIAKFGDVIKALQAELEFHLEWREKKK